MDLFEYQGKQYFAQFGIPISAGEVADTPQEAVAAAERVGYPVVIKAQVLVGGRGKAGGGKLANNAEEALFHATNILKLTIKDHPVRRVWVEHASDIAEEYYASFTLDRSKKLHLGMLSAQGGVEIEDVAATNPEAISTIWVDPVVGLTPAIAREWVLSAKLNPKANEGAIDILLKLYDCYIKGDATLAEINPLILTPDGKVHALDAKVSLDDASEHRHPEWANFTGLEPMDERERMAKEKDLQYVGLEGTVGIIANGAGLAMSTVDIVSQVGGSAANFLDIGGGASADHMANALTVINYDEKVKAIFINIFGGITRCDEVARGIIQAMGRVDLRAPLIVRLDGTNAAEGRKIIEENASDRLIMKPNMLVAAQTAVEIAKGK
ncbi:MAG TPA: ADP-forming succinate--CoA ligase subunit beta [Aggregatilineales bacterium]|nr:ADP-forming succinate--CoA ligase subunit beta [Aggregatilineales bacterium]